MSKEIELKYKLSSPALGREILKSDFLSALLLKNNSRTVSMRAVYYDDKHLTLTSKKIGYRVRKENDQFVATVKWTQAQDDKGLSVRHEYNIDVSEEKADPAVFKDVIKDPDVASILCSIDPIPLFITDFKRELIEVIFGDAVIEVAFDNGSITAGENNSLPICELECELKIGEEEHLVAFGNMLSEKFHLAPLSDSKLKRGLSLLNI
ncbi:MAG: CYTH domain-containing protein [Firmicutes bacterium]|nr:CYTH domain-containing protein [Bacillota bacterium]